MRNFLICWGCLVLLCLHGHSEPSTSDKPEPVQSDWRLVLEDAIFHQEIKGDISAASDGYSAIHRSPDAQRSVVVEALCRDVLCHLLLHREKEAHALFRRIQNEFPEQTEWIMYVSQKVPDAFLRKPILWQDGALTQYDWKETNDMSWAGLSLVETRMILHGNETFWRLSVQSLDPTGYRIIRVDFDPVTLEPVFSQTKTRTCLAFEKAFVSPATNRNLAFQPGDSEAMGFLLRHYPLSLGHRIDTDIYEPSEGASTRESLEVPSIEIVENTPTGRAAAFRVRILNGPENRQFWIEQAEPFRLVQLADGNGIAKLTSQSLAEVDAWKDSSLGGTFLSHPSNWAAGIGPIPTGGNWPPIVLMVPDLKARIWITEVASYLGREDTRIAPDILASILSKYGYSKDTEVAGIDTSQGRQVQRLTGIDAEGNRFYVGICSESETDRMLIASASAPYFEKILPSLDRVLQSIQTTRTE